MTNVGLPEVVVALAVWAVFVVPPLWALVDTLLRPKGAFDAIGQSRATWIVLLILGLVFSCLGVVLGVYYLLSVRPRLKASAPS